ncbi:MAG: tail fiber domain-containing protein [Bacteroidetes bacterium]|nr:tail fiber domain-containing protein [Bacteroidota bacterium]
MKKFFLLFNLIIFLIGLKSSYAQKWSYTGDVATPLFYIGTNNLQPLNFKTNSFQRMTIRSNNGFVGIGLNFTTPNNLLDVRGGDIDVLTANRGYMINNKYVLWHNNIARDIFVGEGAGSSASPGNVDNTLIGYNAGFSGTAPTFTFNTLVGSEAGLKTQGSKNTFVGFRAGYNYSSPGQVVSTFLGAEAGYNEAQGDEDVYVGWRSGYNSLGAYHNTFVGNISGANNTSGSNNTFIGIGSGSTNQKGSGLTTLGAGANVGSTALSNAAAIGAGSIVTQNNQMILGNSQQFVGVGLSGNTTGPQNWLEINTLSPNPVPGFSGLRFRDLTCISTPLTNPGKGLLGVDCNGDVIYVTPPTFSSGSTFGNPCSSPQIPMTSNWEIPTNSFNYMFNEPFRGGVSMVGIGHINGTCANTIGKFEVLNNTYPHAGSFDNSANITGQATIGVFGNAVSTVDESIGVKGVSLGAALSGFSEASGVHGESMMPSGTAINNGIRGYAQDAATESRGGYFLVHNSASPYNFGVKSIVTQNPGTAGILENYGGYFEAWYATGKTFGVVGSITNPGAGISALPTGTNIGVYGYNPSVTPTPPFPTNSWAGYFDGDVNINGYGWLSLSTLISSDRRFKKDIQPISNVLDKINHINGYSYLLDKEQFKQKRFDSERHLGLIAQEVKEVFPELVKQDAQGFYGVSYDGMVPVLLEAIKAQQKTINELSEKLDRINQALGLKDQPSATGNNNLNTLQVTLSDKDAIILNQNVPNPFAEHTVITFNIPEGCNTAVINFYDNIGKMIKSVKIDTRGNGLLNVFGDDLSSGIYIYSLIIDGRSVETKKMIKSK